MIEETDAAGDGIFLAQTVSPQEALKFLDTYGLMGGLFLALLGMTFMYLSERKARTEEIKQAAAQFLEYSKTLDRVTVALDALKYQIDLLSGHFRKIGN